MLRDYQQEAVDHLVKQHRVILGDEQGLGKTLVSLTAAIKLCGDKPRILVLAPRVAVGTWVHELKKWFGMEALVYSGSSKPHEREQLWEKYQEEKPPLLVATYGMMHELQQRRRDWQCIIADEYHKVGLMNHKTPTFKRFCRFSSRYLFLLTGTPVKKGPQNLYGPLHLVSPHRFSTYWGFVNKYCMVIKDVFGHSIGPRPKDPIQFKEMLAPHLIRRTKKKVLKELPPLQRQAIYLDMNDDQRRYYNQLVDHGMIWTKDGTKIACPNEATKLMRLRQLLVSPRLLGLPELGGTIPDLLSLIEDQFDSNEPVVICTPFREAVDLITLSLKSKTSKVYRIYGQMKAPASEVARAFQNEPTPQKALVFTISSGMSFDAYAASNVYFVGAEWSSSDNKQAESRIHRLGQEATSVNAYYLLYPGTVDDAIIKRLDENTMAQNWVLETDYMLSLIKPV